MIKELLALTSCVASIGAGSITPTRNYQHTEDVGNTVVTYKYGTNEVNSVDDLMDGNIYHFEYENVTIQDAIYNFNVYGIYNFARTSSSVVYNYNLDVTSNIFNVRVFRSNYCLGVTNAYGVGLLYASYNEIPDNLLTFDFVYKSDFPIDLINYVSISNFNIVESISYIPPTTIVGVINDFTSEYLFKDIPYVNDMRFTIGGQEITLMTWLVMVFGLITAVGLFILLFIVFRWLFRMFAGCFKPYK